MFYCKISGWQIIRTSQNSSEEFVMIYDLHIEQTDTDEECVEDSKRNLSKTLSLAKENQSAEGVEE